MKIEYVPEFEDEYPRYDEGLARFPLYNHKKKRKKQPVKAWQTITCHYCREKIPKGYDVYWDEGPKWKCSLCHPTPREVTKVYPRGAFRAKYPGTCAICEKPFEGGWMIMFSAKEKMTGRVLYEHVLCKHAS